MAWQCSVHLCSCSIRPSLYAGPQKAFNLSLVILTTSIDLRVSLMATGRAGSAFLPFSLYCSSSLPLLYRLHRTSAGLLSIQALQHTLVTNPAKSSFGRWGKGGQCESGGSVCVTDPAWSLNGGRYASLSFCPTPFLSSFSPQPLGEGEFYARHLIIRDH